MYRSMKRITLTVVAVLLAVPVAAQAKAGIRFDGDIGTANPSERQSFSAMVMREPSDPMGGDLKPIAGARPLVTFRNERTGEVIRVRTTRTNLDGVGTGSVTFGDKGPWTTTMAVGGESLALHGQTFEVGPPRSVRVVGTMEPPPDPPAAQSDGGGFPAWLLAIPAALLAALGIRHLRRRPRELGA